MQIISLYYTDSIMSTPKPTWKT